MNAFKFSSKHFGGCVGPGEQKPFRSISWKKGQMSDAVTVGEYETLTAAIQGLTMNLLEKEKSISPEVDTRVNNPLYPERLAS